MHDPAVKTALGLCVLLAGVCAALLFRHDPAQAVPACASTEEELLLQCRVDEPAPGVRARSSARRGSSRTQSDQRPATVVTPIDSHEPPPALAPEYPETSRPADPRWGPSMEMMLPIAATADSAPRTHKVVDGDTLAGLAERYFGSAARAQEIFQLNRDVLSDAELLPIGVELKLPPPSGRSEPASPAAEGSPLRPLVPVR